MKIFSQFDWRLRLLQLTIVLIPFSYQPRIFLSSLQGLNLELSLVQISAALFVAVSLPGIFQHTKKLSTVLALKLLAVFVAFSWLSILWSADAIRTIVLSAYMSFLFLLVLAVATIFLDTKIRRRDITNPLLIGGVVGASFAWFQFLGFFMGISDNVTLVREMYSADLFGFPRVHSLTLEPQFYASTLIAPITYLAWRILFKDYQNYHIALLALFLPTFALTVSRGGMIALFASFALLLFWCLKLYRKDSLKGPLTVLAGVGVLMLSAFFMLYVFAAANSNSQFTTSFEKFVDQVSLGIIDIKLANDGQGLDGLVEGSTTGRLYMVERALEIIQLSPTNYIIGVGAGSFGPVFQSEFNSGLGNDIVNNHYIEILVELGIVGLGLFLAFFACLGQSIWRLPNRYNILFTSILVAYLIQYLFFSLQTNVTHVWLFVGVALGMCLSQSKTKKVKS